MIAAYLLMVLNFFMDRKLVEVIRNLTPRVFYEKADKIAKGGKYEAVKDDDNEMTGIKDGTGKDNGTFAPPPGIEPPFMSFSLGDWKGFGEVNNKHQMLFWGGEKGSEASVRAARPRIASARGDCGVSHHVTKRAHSVAQLGSAGSVPSRIADHALPDPHPTHVVGHLHCHLPGGAHEDGR